MTTKKFSNALGNIGESYVNEAVTYSAKKKNAWIKWGAMAACLCIVVAAFITPIILQNLRAASTGDDQYGNTVSYAGWSDDRRIYEGALNKELLQSEENTHLPVFKMDTAEDLEQFKSNYETVFTMANGYDNVLSFEAALAKAQWDREGFFKDHSLLIIYIPANSGSLRFGIKEVVTTDNSICIHVEQKNDPETLIENMAGWFLLVEVDDEEIEGYTSIDAVFNAK